MRRIVLTHWHEDHAGSAAELAARLPPLPPAPPCVVDRELEADTAVFGHGGPIAHGAADALREAAAATT
ncbi:MBL fold metallo-hydrolase [Streptomyces sp. NPDC003717]|uniref:MBL fold metallo-hydrolase n=1 Tax=Streptomyces sp. NPDC003717 TaxID=3154276 RepID=UPI0033B3B7F1